MAKKQKPWYYGALDYNVNDFESCCGIGVVSNIDICIDVYDDETDQINTLHKITQRAAYSEIKRMTKELSRKKKQMDWGDKRDFKYYMLTITDENKEQYKLYNKALINSGWKVIDKTKTLHRGDNYFIYIYKREFPNKRVSI